MTGGIRFWFIKGYDRAFENQLDIIREALNDAGSKDFALKAYEVTAEAGDNNIHQELTGGTAGKLRAINLGVNYATLAPPAAPRPEVAQLIQFRDFISPAKPMEHLLPQESLMEFTAQLSHKVGEILLLNAGNEGDGYISFENGRIKNYGFGYGDEFILRYHGGIYKLDVYNIGDEGDASRGIDIERVREAVDKSGMSPAEIVPHKEEMIHDFWKVAKEGFNHFYATRLTNLGTTQTNFGTLHKVSDPGVGHYDIYPEGVSYAYPKAAGEPEKKKPWWKRW